MPERTSWLACGDHLEHRARVRQRAGSACSRRRMFSTPTTASSTSSPMAIASPPSVMVLMVRPKARNTSTVIRIEIGMAVSEIDGGAHVQQEDEQHDRDHHGGLEQHALDVADRGLDEGRLPELDVGRRHAGRQRLLNLAERGLDLAGQRDGVGARLLLDADDDGRLALVAGVAALDAGRELDGRDLLQQDRLAVAVERRRCWRGPRAAWSGRHCGSGIRGRSDRRSRRRCWCRTA